MRMRRSYLTQAFTLLKQNRLFSMLYIAGTGLAIAMTVVVAVVYYVKLAPIYPERNRDNTLYLTYVSFKSEQGNDLSVRFVVSGFAGMDLFA